MLQPPSVSPDPSSTGLDPKVAGLLCYLAGFVSGIIFLVLEKQSRYVRIHALQSIIVNVAFIAASFILGLIPILGWILGGLLTIVAIIVWIGLMLLALQGRIYKLPYIGDFAEQQVNRF